MCLYMRNTYTHDKITDRSIKLFRSSPQNVSFTCDHQILCLKWSEIFNIFFLFSLCWDKYKRKNELSPIWLNHGRTYTYTYVCIWLISQKHKCSFNLSSSSLELCFCYLMWDVRLCVFIKKKNKWNIRIFTWRFQYSTWNHKFLAKNVSFSIKNLLFFCSISWKIKIFTPITKNFLQLLQNFH